MSWNKSNKKRKSSGGAPKVSEPPRVRLKKDDTEIADFVGRFAFLANGYICQQGVRVGGHVYPSVEHALQASKTDDEIIKKHIKNAPTAIDAKRIGNKLPVDKKLWKTRSREIMTDLLRDKFKRNKALAQALIQTRGKGLVFANTWNDTFWGVCKGRGHNFLGQLLEDTRTELVTAVDGGLGKWIAAQYDLCTTMEANATSITLQAQREREPTDDPLIVLRQGQFFTFGKSSGCDVTLRHGSISRIHAVLLLLDDGLLHLLDLQSTHGTRVNEKIVKAFGLKRVRKDDVLRFGASSCSYAVTSITHAQLEQSRDQTYASVMAENAVVNSGSEQHASKSAGVTDFGDGCTIFVSNVPFDATEAQLHTHFSGSGTILRTHIPLDRVTRTPRGIAFITFSIYQEALKAQQLEGSILPDDPEMRMLGVRLAKPSSKTGGRWGRKPSSKTGGRWSGRGGGRGDPEAESHRDGKDRRRQERY